MKRHIIIVTRRFEKEHKGIGVDNFFPHEISKEHYLFHFWANKFSENEKFSKKNNNISENDVFTKKDIPTFDRQGLEAKFKKLNDLCPHPIYGFDYLLNVYEFGTIENPGNIFVYHQWLDKQGFPDAINESDNNKHFLVYLREFIADILNEREIDINDITVNWLIHDSDLLPNRYDGCLYYNGVMYSPNFMDTSSEEKSALEKKKHDLKNLTQEELDILEQLAEKHTKEFKKKIEFPAALEKDNIWCFVHEENVSAFYSYFIVKFNENSELHTSEKFYEALRLDREGCKRRLEVLRLADDDTVLNDNQLLFILQKKPDGRDFYNGMTVKTIKQQLKIEN